MTTQNQSTAQPSKNQSLIASGTFDNNTINQQLALAAERCHLISSATSASLPPGCVVSCSVVQLGPADVYDVGGGRKALLRTALLKLANAAGIVWNGSASGRIDDRRHPHLVHYHSEGAWRTLDGTWQPVVGEVLIDLRDGSSQVEKILESARARVDEHGQVRMTAAEVGRVQLRDTRSKILEHAQSKSELRGIRKALAIRSYTLDELRKPFCVFKPIWVGTDCQEDRAALRESYLRGASVLWGARPAPRLMAPARPHALPAADFTADGELIDEPDPEPEEPVEEPAATNEPLGQETATADGPERTGFVIPGGNAKGTPLEDASDGDLQYWADRLEKALADGSARPQYRERDEALACAMRDEQARRG